MRQRGWQDEKAEHGKDRLLFAIAVTALIHATLFRAFNNNAPTLMRIDDQPISVVLVTPTQPPSVEVPAPAKPMLPEPVPEAAPKPPKEPAEIPKVQPEVPEPTQNLPPTRQPDTRPPDGQSSLPVQASPDPEGDVLIPDRWRLPVGARTSLDKTKLENGSLGQALDCLKGFRTECADQRKSLFAEEQLSETDLVWMASHPHSGLSDSRLYGLSEAEIRDRLGIPTAGQNGLMILPGLKIDGAWWDALHGVNKACEYGVGIGENGKRELKKRCPELRPSSKDRIGFKPLAE
jgi:hypothetical protein